MDIQKNHDASDPVDAISELTTDVVDVIKGYDTMRDRAEGKLKPVVDRLHKLHEAHATELLELVSKAGGKPEDQGSMMAAVHTAVATARDWFGARDGSAIDQVISGERQLLQSYDKATAMCTDHDGFHRTLETQKKQLSSEIEAIS